MKKFLLFAVFSFLMLTNVLAQPKDNLFGNSEKLKSRQGFVFNINGDLDFPAADMAKRFGTSYRIGLGVWYKTKNNWVIGPKYDFIIGDIIKEDSLLAGQRDINGNVLNQDGERTQIRINEHGYLMGVQVGKIFNTSKTVSDNGIMLLTTVGFMQHKINLFDKDNAIPSIRGDYKKGYDRLSNGLFVEEYINYSYFANNGLLNFHIGLDITAGFTKGRRDYLYDVMRPDNQSRVDILFGIRGGWYIPLFKRKSEEFFFE